MKRYPLLVCFLFFSFPGLVKAQALAQMVLPDGNQTWFVQVITTGGILGRGDIDFAVSSEGKTICNQESRCPKDFKTSDFQPLVENVQADGPSASAVRVVSFCNDCITRTIIISRRDSMGVVHTHTATWDDTTKSKLPLDIIRIYDGLRALMK